MRILYYNWVDYHDPRKRGGGVTVYQANVIREFEALEDVEAVFLSSGTAYTLRDGAPFWRALPPVADEADIPRFEIVNSGVMAPSHSSFSNPAQVSHEPTSNAFFDFVEKNGPFDVIHFNNLEGLPAEVLALKDRWPDTKVVLSLHNYYPFCAQVNLWAEERENCSHFDNGRGCVICDPRPPEHSLRIEAVVENVLEKSGLQPKTTPFIAVKRTILASGIGAKRALRLVKRAIGAGQTSEMDEIKKAQTPRRLALDIDPSYHKMRRETFTRLINENCSAVLGVSDRVCKVAEHHGVSPDLLRTSYIGTAHSERWDSTPTRDRILGEDGTLTMAFLGYMRRDKGYFFLTHALRALPDEMAKRINLRVYARAPGEVELRQIRLLGSHLKSVEFLNGYHHDQLDALLDGVDVGLVPVLWEDNLPQVAIEMHARRIPLLTSNLGGAQELGGCPEMVFKAGSIKDFHAKIAAILDERITTDQYWQKPLTPVSNAGHVAELLSVYSSSE